VKTDVLVIGGGLSGLSAALGAQRKGAQTVIVSAGMGVLYVSSGCIDLMAYPHGKDEMPVMSPLEAIGKMKKENPSHPYAKIGVKNLSRALDGFSKTCRRQGLAMFGDGSKNRLIPTALGTARPTGIVPASMVKGDLMDKSLMTIIGFEGLRDFFPRMVARELGENFAIGARVKVFDPSPFMKGSMINTVGLGRAFENLSFCEEFAGFINDNSNLDDRIGIPAVLGVDGAGVALKTLEEISGRSIFEIPMLPPSLPGKRIYQALKRELFEMGGQIINGCPVISVAKDGDRVVSVGYKAGGSLRSIEFKSCVAATGSFFSGGLRCGRKAITESIFNLPICGAPDTDNRFNPNFLAKEGHPVCKSGVMVDAAFRPCGKNEKAVFSNLFACGDLLGGFDSLSERSGGGVAISTGTISGESAGEAAQK